jgi:RNA polymerase sigma factor (sigma-70 family)
LFWDYQEGAGEAGPSSGIEKAGGTSMSIEFLFQAACVHDAAARTDGQLLEQFLSRRDERAFAALVKRHGPTVLGVCRRILNNETDAEDAFQATFLVLIGKAHSLTGRALLGDWLHQAARYTALKARVAASRRRVKEPTVARPEAAPVETDTNDWLARLDHELRRLPEKYRLPMILCDLEGMTRRQAAEALDWPDGTVAGRLARGRAMLARRLLRGEQLGVGALLGLLAAQTAQASMPVRLTDSLVQAAARLVAGETACGTLSSQTLTLADGVIKAMFWNRLRIGMLVILASTLLAAGGGLTYRALAGGRPEAPPLHAPALIQQEPQPEREVAVPAQDKAQAAIGEDQFTLNGHTGNVLGVAFSPDGKRLASASADGTVKIWDAATGKELLTLRGHDKQVNCVAFGSERNLIASGGADGTVKVWDATNGKELLTFTGHRHLGSSVHSLAFSPDGTRLASGNGSPGGMISVKVWNARTGKEDFTLDGYRGMISGLAFSRDGKRLASASGDRKLRLFDAVSGKEIAAIRRPDNYFASVGFSPDGKRVVSANDDKTVTVWDAASGEQLLVARGHTREVSTAAFSPDGTLLASAGFDATLRLWDAATAKELDSRGGYAREIHSVAFNPEGTQLATGSADGVIKVWQIKPASK